MEGTLRSFAQGFLHHREQVEAGSGGGQQGGAAAGSTAAGGSGAAAAAAMPSLFESLALATEYERTWEQLHVLGSGHFGKAVLLRHRESGSFAVVKQIWAGE